MVNSQEKSNTAVVIRKGSTHAREKKYASTYDEFVLWYALPHFEKKKYGLEDQKSFAAYHGVHENTVSLWRNEPGFLLRVKALRDQWGAARTSDVLASIYRSAISGGKEAPQAQKLWYQVVEGWNEKTEVKNIKKVEIGVNDVRFLIDSLPEPYKTEHNANLRKLIEDAQRLRNSGEFKNREREEDRPADGISDATYSDASDVSRKGRHEVAKGHSFGVCPDMGWPVQPYHYQGPSWRW